MGYTHYWTFKDIERGDADKVDKAFKLAIKRCTEIVHYAQERAVDAHRLSGYTAHTAPGRYGGIEVNGKGDLSHEPFCIAEHFKDNVGFHFCKTARKPYDTVVTACLIVLKHYLKDYIQVDSDGDDIEWTDGWRLAKFATGLKTLQLPDSLRRGKFKIVG